MPLPTPENSSPHPSDIDKLRDRHNGGKGLRPWTADDLIPNPEDFYQERLYCVRWVKSTEKVVRGKIKIERKRVYEEVTKADLAREEQAEPAKRSP
ncbi:hypothetical protein DEMA109039_20775 [Deinococcus marmoris]